MPQEARLKNRFYNWLLSDEFPLHFAMMMVVSMTFDTFLTFQVLFNSKDFFVRTEKNGFLIYAYQHNLGWLYAIILSVFYVFVILLSKKEKSALHRYLLFLLPTIRVIMASVWLFY